MPTAGNKIYPSDIPDSTYVRSPGGTYTGAITVPYLTAKRDRISGASNALGGEIDIETRWTSTSNSTPVAGVNKFLVSGANWLITNSNSGDLMYVRLSDGYTYFYGSHSDYAEKRLSDTDEPGRCIQETENGIMTMTTARLQPGAHIISDTYGIIIGVKSGVPICIKGRVMAYPWREKKEYQIGDCVCSAPNGTIDIMNKIEIRTYPERIIGTVCEIPDYKIWNDTPVNGRIWIKVR